MVLWFLKGERKKKCYHCSSNQYSTAASLQSEPKGNRAMTAEKRVLKAKMKDVNNEYIELLGRLKILEICWLIWEQVTTKKGK